MRSSATWSVVRVPDAGRQWIPRRRPSPIALLLAFGFLAALAVLAAVGRLLVAVPAGYALASIVLFALYARDKRAARSGRRRIPEATLHLLAFAGGWPGALVAQTTLRHKTRKQPFGAVFVVTVLLNCVLLASLGVALGSFR